MPLLQPNQPMVGPNTMMLPKIQGQLPTEDNSPKWTVDQLAQNQQEFLELQEEKQRNILGELMYPKVQEKCDDHAKVSKITGMLIDLEILELEEIVDILNNEEALEERIKEALEVIEESED